MIAIRIFDCEQKTGYPDTGLADLCNKTTMPSELRKAHQNNDRAVMMNFWFHITDISDG